jgi:hypothetical protein
MKTTKISQLLTAFLLLPAGVSGVTNQQDALIAQAAAEVLTQKHGSASCTSSKWSSIGP